MTCDGGRFQNPAVSNVVESGIAIVADGTKVAGAVLLRDGFVAEGQVRLHAAQISGNLECGGGKFRNPMVPDVAGSGTAFTAVGAKVSGAVHFGNGFTAQGQVRLHGAEIKGSFDCQLGMFESLDLTNMSAGALQDDQGSWPESGKLFLDGFVYGRISDGRAMQKKG